MGQDSVRRLLRVMAALSVILLSGCGIDLDQTVTFYQDGVWEADTIAIVPQDPLGMSGSPADIEAEIEEQVAEWEAQGARVSWEVNHDETTTRIVLHLEGDDLDSLQEIVFTGDANLDVMVADAKRQIRYTQNVSQGLLGGLNNLTLTLKGGSIISTNGQRIDRGTVRWVNPSGRIEATLTEKSRLDPTVLFVVGGVGVVVVVAMLFARSTLGRGRVTQVESNPNISASSQIRYCNNCGTPLATSAKFCHKCGHRLQ